MEPQQSPPSTGSEPHDPINGLADNENTTNASPIPPNDPISSFVTPHSSVQGLGILNGNFKPLSSVRTATAIMAQSPTPDERIESLQGWLDKRPLFEILREGLALNKGQDNDIPEIARPLMQHLKLICIDTESYTDNTDELTELGIVQLKYSQADSTRNPGEHGLLLLKQMAFLQFCVVENAHLVSGPKENHYGHPRWTTFGELGMILHGIINKRITTNKELEGCVEPVVLLGHDLKHDIRHLQKSALQYDISSQRSIVATVDTQVLAKEVGLYHPSAKTAKEQATLQIGLLDLAQAIGFEHKLLHTACYDAASTIICAIHIALPKDLSNPGNANLTLQGVVDQVKVASTQKTPPFGTVHCCARCSNRSHSKSDCTEIVSCDACKKFDTHQTSHTDEHCEMYCIHIAAFKAGMRRVFIAAEKKKKVNETFSTELKSKGTSAHPFSSWPKPSWPSEDPTQVMADFDRFPPTFKVLNLHNVTNYGPLPAKGDWKLKDGTIRRDRTRSYATIATSSSGGRPQQGAVLAMRGRGQPSTPSSGQGTPHSGSTDRSAPGGRSGGGSWRDSSTPQQGAVLATRGRGQPSTPSSGQGTPHSGSTDRSAPGGRSGGGSWRDSNWRRK